MVSGRSEARQMHYSRCTRTLDAFIQGFGRDLWWLPDAAANLTALSLCVRHNSSVGRASACDANGRQPQAEARGSLAYLHYLALFHV